LVGIVALKGFVVAVYMESGFAEPSWECDDVGDKVRWLMFLVDVSC
jgi:hypothetical protein